MGEHEHFVDGPTGPVRWPHRYGPDHPYWSRGQVDWSSGLGPMHVRDVGPTGGTWTYGSIGDCPPARGCPQCIVAVEIAAQEDQARSARGAVPLAGRSGRAEVALLVPVFGAPAALAIAEATGGGTVLSLKSVDGAERMAPLAATLARTVDAHPAEELSVAVVAQRASGHEIALYVEAAEGACKASGRPVQCSRWDLGVDTVPEHRPEVGVQDAVLAFGQRYQAKSMELRITATDEEQLTAQLKDYMAGRRLGIDAETGTARDSLILAAGIALYRLDHPPTPTQVFGPPAGVSITGGYDDWYSNDMY